MIPISLSFGGLNSYREMQHIDFTPMSSTGVFGIFGPTGAGKSTVLDGITLALYGEVNRSKNKAQGVINLSEDKAQVEFVFQLGAYTYKVERVLVREKGKEFSAQVRACRLTRLEDNLVLASDKAEEVNQAIVDLIGLRSDDFLRSVALPQGQFDKFLRLTANERGKMLEHIFGLEQYGQTFQEKVKLYGEKVLQQERENLLVLEQMGDCSKATYKAEQAKLKANEAELEASKVKVAAAQTEMQSWEFYHSKYQEGENISQKLEINKNREAEINHQRLQLETATKAETLRHQIEQIQQLYLSLQNATKAKAQSEQDLAVCRDNIRQLELEQANLQEIRNRDYDRWLIDLQSLAGAKVEAAKADKLIQMEKELMAKVEAAEIAKADQVASLGSLQTAAKELETAKANQQKQQAEYKQVIAKTNYLNEGKILQQACLNQMEKLNQGENSLTKAKEKLSQLTDDIYSLVNTAAYQELPLDKTAAFLEDKLEAAKVEYEQGKAQNQAFVAAGLAQGLAEGEPCPVCGSGEHPRPAVAMNDLVDVSTLEEEHNHAGLLVDRHQSLLENYNREQANIAAELQPAYEEAKAKYHEAAASWQTWLDGQPETYLEDLARAIEEANLGEAKGALALVDLEQKQKNNRDEQESLQQRAVELASEVAGLTRDLANTRKNLVDLGAVETVELLEAKIEAINSQKTKFLADEADCKVRYSQADVKLQSIEGEYNRLLGESQNQEKTFASLKAQLEDAVRNLGFDSVNSAKNALLNQEERTELSNYLKGYEQEQAALIGNLASLKEQLAKANFQLEAGTVLAANLRELQQQHEVIIGNLSNQKLRVDTIGENQEQWLKLTEANKQLIKEKQLIKDLQSLIKGSSFVNFLAKEYLRQVLLGANEYLASFSNGRFALEMHQTSASLGQEFMLRDGFNGGQLRPINTMSGGEIFLASLSLALALSTHIQLRGEFQLGFFFLDEGFGTLDEEKLEVLMSAVEKLPAGGRMVGIITHVAEVKNRLPYFWQVQPATGGEGSKISWHVN